MHQRRVGHPHIKANPSSRVTTASRRAGSSSTGLRTAGDAVSQSAAVKPTLFGFESLNGANQQSSEKKLSTGYPSSASATNSHESTKPGNVRSRQKTSRIASQQHQQVFPAISQGNTAALNRGNTKSRRADVHEPRSSSSVLPSRAAAIQRHPSLQNARVGGVVSGFQSGAAVSSAAPAARVKSSEQSRSNTGHNTGSLQPASINQHVTDSPRQEFASPVESGLMRVFTSSTFVDMQEERSVLSKQVMNVMRSECARQAVDLVDVDLRWGVTAEQSSGAQVLLICLRELSRSNVFLCFLGQRYGWHQPAESKDKLLQQTFAAAQPSFPWLQELSDRSVTEIEVTHGSLSGRLSNQMLEEQFFFRDAAAIEQYPEDQRKALEAESEHCRQMQQDLKHRIIAASKPVQKYCEASEVVETSLSVLRAALGKISLPSREEDGGGGISSILIAERDQAAFSAHRLASYVPRPAVEQILLSSMSSNPRLAFVGSSGSGKSAIMARMSQILNQGDKHRLSQKTYHEPLHLCHFVGASEGQHEMMQVLRRFSRLGCKMLGLPEPTAVDFVGSQADFIALIEQARRVQESNTTSNCVNILIDAVDQLVDEPESLPVGWLMPFQNTSDEGHKTFNGEPRCGYAAILISCTPGKWEKWLRQHKFFVVECPALDVGERGLLVRSYLSKFGKTLPGDLVQTVAESKSAASPLFLRLMLEELKIVSSFESLQSDVASILSCHGVEELLLAMVQRWKQDFGEQPVSQIMQSLASARTGLTESELTTLLDTSVIRLSPLMTSMQTVLFSRQGVWAPQHQAVARVAQRMFLADDQSKLRAHRNLANLFLEQDHGPRRVQEYPWQAVWARVDILEEAECITKLPMLSDLKAYDPAWLRIRLKELNKAGIDVTGLMLSNRSDPELFAKLGGILHEVMMEADIGTKDIWLKTAHEWHTAAMLKYQNWPERKAEVSGKYGWLRCQMMEIEQGVELVRNAVEEGKQHGIEGTSIHATNCRYLGEMEYYKFEKASATSLAKKAAEVHEQLLGPHHISTLNDWVLYARAIRLQEEGRSMEDCYMEAFEVMSRIVNVASQHLGNAHPKSIYFRLVFGQHVLEDMGRELSSAGNHSRASQYLGLAKEQYQLALDAADVSFGEGSTFSEKAQRGLNRVNYELDSLQAVAQVDSTNLGQ